MRKQDMGQHVFPRLDGSQATTPKGYAEPSTPVRDPAADDFDERLAGYLLGGWGRPERTQRRGDPQWYAVRTGTRQERVVAAGLAERHFAIFLPMETNWCGQPRERHMEPLMPGYVFVLCDPEDFADIHGLEGAAGFVRYLREDGVGWPAPFPFAAILGLQCQERAGAFDRTRTVKPKRYNPKKGTGVKIMAGAYYGFLAKVLAAPMGGRAKLLIEGQGLEKPRHTTLDTKHLEAA